MNYRFKKIIIHNFLSFGDATIELEDRGYCLIKGKNHNPLDKALSNGSGKSTIISSICWCLTGETIQGIKSHIENDFVSGGCFVSLYLSVDKDNYVITRYKNHEKFKTDLKIIKNDTDISGKGIKESSIVLAQHLPELNSKLLSSVILLGQGLPNSFTKNSPSGRKELLEELTGSDFMIQDIKNRISTRLDVLNNEKRKIEDDTLSLTTQNKVYNDNLIKLNEKKNTYSSIDYSGLIEDLEYKVHTLEGNLNTQNELVLNYEKTNQEIYDQQLNLNQHKQQEITNTQNKYNGRIESLKNDYMESSNSLKSITQELNKLYSIKDTCPTCNQKIPNVFKPDTTKLEQEQQRYKEIVKFNEESYSTLQAQLNEELNAINDTFKDKEVELNSSKLSTQQSLSNAKRERDELNTELNKANLELANYQTEKNNLLKNLQSINGEIAQLEMKINETNNKLLYNNKELENVVMHLETLNKINTLVKRDFRGYLLLNIIRYIQNKAQEYCQYIFNSNNLKVVLDGNDIDILFLDKPFESLSGGEKQKIDVIIQFAIRDMMNTYLDFKSNILFLDEITDNLDTVGCNGLFNLISKTLIDLSSIFIISHHEDELILPIDDEILVEKNEKGISSVR